MAEFYSYVDRVRENINQIATATENIKILANNYQQATTTDQESSQSEKVEELVKSTNKKVSLPNYKLFYIVLILLLLFFIRLI